MNILKKLVLTILTVWLILMPVTVSAGSTHPTAIAWVEFASPVNLNQVYSLFGQSLDFRIKQIVYTFNVDGEENTAGYSPSSDDDVAVTFSKLQGLHSQLLSSLGVNYAGTSESAQMQELLQHAMTSYLQEANRRVVEFDVVQVELEGNYNTLASLKSTFFTVEIQSTDLRPAEDETSLTGESVDNWESWAPEEGNLLVQPHSWSGYRYVQNRFWWDNTSGFNSRSTYEQDFFLNASDGSTYGPGTYLNRSQDWRGVPNVYYWASDLPRAYLDTRASDPAYQVAFTIGSAQVSSVSTYRWYYTYIMTTNGDANIDSASLQGQIGHRTPSGCYSTWCSFSEYHEDLTNYGKWGITVPNYIWWRK
ncbi:hypothetical protein KC614_02730 [candidate division WWE3 bacterium]|uniref:Sporulation stage II protein D amidase enhancer LytB N-terminal domain-containing protein n=1 Tax=candidate division WWE3 bacterium TaxID=2053526 RepID=A0A955RS07_UNCKA|nr:hypothetical protein [candidate division WWE3 bacterium]